MTPDAYVHALFRALLTREPDESGLRYWVRFIEAGGDPTEVLAAILESDEYRRRDLAAADDGGAALADDVPSSLGEEARIAMAARCRDTDSIAKVADAGTVRVEPDGTRVQIMHNGLKIVPDGYYGAWMTRLIALCRGHHEPQEERAFHEILKHVPVKATMLELGGYWAYFSLWFLKNEPNRRAIVLEPDPVHLAVGRANAALNGLAPEFIAGFVGRDAARSLPFQTEESGEISLRRFSVPQLFEELGIQFLDILHCDAQGVERDVLESCRGLFRQNRIRWVFVSTHAHQISGDPLTHHRCLALLRETGAMIEVEHEVHESFSGDGLIVARFGPAPDGWTPISISYNRYSQSLFRNPLYDLAARRPHLR